MKEKILELRKQGKSYNEISNILNCAKSSVSYHCNEQIRIKHFIRQKHYRKQNHPYVAKINRFRNEKINNSKKTFITAKTRKQLTDKVIDFQKRGNLMNQIKFAVEDVINKFGENPKCYLTGQEIDVNKPSTYHFDHIIPVSRGGDNSLDNLGICTKNANLAKKDMTPDEFINLCKQVLKYNNVSL